MTSEKNAIAGIRKAGTRTLGKEGREVKHINLWPIIGYGYALVLGWIFWEYFLSLFY